MAEMTESQERLARPLIKLARLNNVATSYIGQLGEFHEIDDDVLVRVLEALGVDASSPEAISESLKQTSAKKRIRLVSGTSLATFGQESRVYINHDANEIPVVTLTLEDGSTYAGKLTVSDGDGSAAYPYEDAFYVSSSVVIPADVPLGYHTLTVTCGEQSATSRLIVAPERVPLLPGLVNGQMWGWMAQLYSVRSHTSWGVGDFADLALLLRDAAQKTHADYMLVNPLHAGEPVAPLTPSPYLPDSRRFINVTYIRPEDVPEYESLSAADRAEVEKLHASVAALNDDVTKIDRDAMWTAKMPALWRIYRAPRSEARQQAYEKFLAQQGSELDAYATWCVCFDMWGEPQDTPDSWIRRYSITSPEVKELIASHQETFDFYRWLQWVATDQLAAAQHASQAAGMRIGLMMDMAVGVHPLGADVWGHPERFAKNVSVGAPPDFYNQQGQDWSQPPFNPNYLEDSGYQAYSDLIHQMFQGAGALRIDHILGLFRLWWVPAGRTAKYGTYVHYDYNVMLGILAIEATRAHGVIVGEDLGVVPDYVATELKKHGLLGSVIEWFSKDGNGNFVDPKTYREMAITSVTTHDLPPTAGYLNYEQVKIREELGLLTEPVESFKAEMVKEHKALLSFLVSGGFLDQSAADDEAHHEQDIIEAMHKVIKASPSKLLNAAIVDAVGERRTQNQPGTNNEYPNWRVPLADGQLNPVYAEDLFSLPRVQSLARVMNQ